MNKYKKMAYNNLAITVIVFQFLAFGCKDVIIVELNSANPAIVIEATISDNGLPSRVAITKSTDFYKPSLYPAVSGAKVIVDDSEGNSFLFTEVTEGIYENTIIKGKPGVEYSIEVLTEEKIYNAVSTMPSKMVLDTLTLEEAPKRPNRDDNSYQFFLRLFFQDQKGIDNYARIRMYNKGFLLSGFNIYEDKVTDCNYINYRLIINANNRFINIGDTLTVELMSIDKAAFDFFKTANSVNASGGSGRGPGSTSAAPANPVTNWSNKALGYFSAYAVSQKTIIISN